MFNTKDRRKAGARMRFKLMSIIGARRNTLGALIVFGLAITSACGAEVQGVAAMVNGEPITQLDIANRIRLEELSNHKAPTHQEALQALIEDKLKVDIAKRYLLEISDKEVEGAFTTIARRAGMASPQFADALTKSGVSVPAFKSKLKADIAWGQIIRGKFPSINVIGDKEVAAIMPPGEKMEGAQQYTVRQILFIVQHGSPPAAYEARLREAEALRSRFQSCSEGIAYARSLRDVAVREPLIRISTDIAAPQREILDNTPVGHLTPPAATAQGVETFAMCGKDQTNGDSPFKRAARDKILEERFQTQAARYMQELRRGAMIEIR